MLIKDSERTLKIVWLVACLAIFVGFVIFKGQGNMQRLLTWTMLALCFPLGLLAIPLVIITGFLAQMISPLGSLIQINDYLMVWFWLFVLGYIQWFLLLPGVVRLVKRFFSDQPQ